MKIELRDPPRAFTTGLHGDIELKDCAAIELAPGEQVTLTAEGAEHDVTRTAWGFYATASLNARLPQHGLRPALVRGSGKFFVVLVAGGQEDEFAAYLQREQLERLCWLDDEAALAGVARAAAGP